MTETDFAGGASMNASSRNDYRVNERDLKQQRMFDRPLLAGWLHAECYRNRCIYFIRTAIPLSFTFI